MASGGKKMFLWILAGYVVSAVAFYSFIVATAQEEPQQSAATVIEIGEWQRQREREEPRRKAA